ncbi:MAG: acyl-CoA thioesterase [Candidatus Lokiarchaeota archaeon]|nr:acyl-CoA thioesterase [Candidatus Lokiarchaeota archaeon]MBD3202014.1 acyl-CoA thioesterase [Candidatus Lokiarchaeota archaeon]
MESKPVSDSQVEIAEVMQPQHANPANNVFGGVIMSIIDNAALIVASRHTHLNCVTASVDRLDFLSPVFIGNLVVAKSSLNYVGKTSMEIGVRVEAECLITGKKAHVASAYLTFVALDENDKPIIVPELILKTEEEKRRFKEGKERKEKRVKKIRNSKPQGPCIQRIDNVS